MGLVHSFLAGTRTEGTIEHVDLLAIISATIQIGVAIMSGQIHDGLKICQRDSDMLIKWDKNLK